MSSTVLAPPTMPHAILVIFSENKRQLVVHQYKICFVKAVHMLRTASCLSTLASENVAVILLLNVTCLQSHQARTALLSGILFC